MLHLHELFNFIQVLVSFHLAFFFFANAFQLDCFGIRQLIKLCFQVLYLFI
jgi:hypothetical protein